MDLLSFYYVKIHHILISTGSQKWGCLENRICLMLSEIIHFSITIDTEIFFSPLSVLQKWQYGILEVTTADQIKATVTAHLKNPSMFQYAMHGARECTKVVKEVQCVLFYFGARWENKFEFTQIAPMHLFYTKNSGNCMNSFLDPF